jgi:hypothetical protein
MEKSGFPISRESEKVGAECEHPGIERAPISVDGRAPSTASIVVGDVKIVDAIVVYLKAVRPSLKKP